jgi:hypothetical protein
MGSVFQNARLKKKLLLPRRCGRQWITYAERAGIPSDSQNVLSLSAGLLYVDRYRMIFKTNPNARILTVLGIPKKGYKYTYQL